MENLDKPTIDALNTALDEGELGPLRAALPHVDLALCGDEVADWVLINATMTDHAAAILDALCEAGLDMAAAVPVDDGGATHWPRVDRLLVGALGGGLTTPEVVAWLLQHGADVDRRVGGESLLGRFLAVGANLDLAVLDTVLDAGPDVNAAGADGATPLMRAASRGGYGRAQAIERLLARGADPARRDRDNRTAADYAAAVPVPEYIALLKPAAQTTPTARCAAHDVEPGGWFVLEPFGEPRVWRWSMPAANAAAAQQHIETCYGASRTPIGPFAALELLDVGDASRGADAHAALWPGSMAPGQLVVLTLSAAVPPHPYIDAPGAPPRAVFVVSGVFDPRSTARARACVAAQRGWSVIARLGSLTLMADGWPEAVAATQAG